MICGALGLSSIKNEPHTLNPNGGCGYNGDRIIVNFLTQGASKQMWGNEDVG